MEERRGALAHKIKRRREGKRADDRKVRNAITEAMPKLAFTLPALLPWDFCTVLCSKPNVYLRNTSEGEG